MVIDAARNVPPGELPVHEGYDWLYVLTGHRYHRAMDASRRVTPGRLRRLADELLDEQLGAMERSSDPDVLVDELDYAMRPPRHERRVASYGSLVFPTEPVEVWEARTGLYAVLNQVTERADDEVRRYADGLSSWAVRTSNGIDGLVVFDRGISSERDLVVLAEATGAMVVQRHPNSEVRLVGSFGVARWDGIGWHVEPPASLWLEMAGISSTKAEAVSTVNALLRFAVHDLGAGGIGAIFVIEPSDWQSSAFERRLPDPPMLSVHRPQALGPLRHVLSQLDGAVLVDRAGVVRDLGVRISPTSESEANVAPMGGTRHTAARRYSADDPHAVVIVVSEAGPVTVFRAGEVVGRSIEQSVD